jgi:1,4-dihydroxy-6-naphthoate synthase
MDEAVMRQHIDLYVNAYSIDLGEAGRRAVERLLEVHRTVNPGAPPADAPVFA